MARARSGGGGSTIAAVLFGIGTFVFMILAIIFYTQVSGANEAADNAKKELSRVATKMDLDRDEVKAIRAEGGTVVSGLLDQNEQLKSDLNNTEKKVSDLTSELAAANKRADAAEDSAEAFRKDAENAVAQAQEVKTLYAAAGQQLKARVDKQAQDAAAQTQRIKGMGDKLSSQLSDTRGELQQKNAALALKLEQANTEVNRLTKVINDRKKSGSILQDITTKDGNIVSLLQGQDKVYINLGANNKIQLGMTFEVFSGDEVIQLTDFGQLRGKATIEVINVDDNSAIARITQLKPNQSVSPGDQIVNAVYNPNAIQKFYVYGDFNLNGQGAPTREDRKQIESMIDRWGGQFSEGLTADVDFLVLGAQPEAPKPLAQGVTDSTLITEFVKAEKEYKTYQELVGEARLLSIPILNQNRFLALVGYYER
ncbi:FlgT C-terminal domain-containing protein [Poriferisphaera sp. WC338]|uniref:FlgT C-terminal domain-containing protein n=1 Tax=Poriferisphaera sp. WC338 TaxID=3425129 RepID=UPI003D8173E7